MQRALVVVADTAEALALGEEAGQFAASTDAELHLVRFVDRAEYQNRLQRAATGTREIESIQQATEYAEELAEQFASDTLDGLDVDVVTRGIVDDMPDAILEYAGEHDCDHVFITGRERSPTGKAVFGDAAQSVILNFDGPVTVRLG